MRKFAWIIAIPIAAAACQKSSAPFDEGYGSDTPGQTGTGGYPGQQGTDGYGQGGTNGYGQQGTDHQGMGQMGSDTAPQPIQDLRKNVEQMRGMGEVQNPDLAKSLRSLADAVAALPNADQAVNDAVGRIRSYADRIETAAADSDMAARWTKRALNDGVEALKTYQKAQGIPGMETRMTQLSDQLDRFDDTRLFTEQKDAYVNTLEQMTDALTQLSTRPGMPRGTN